MCNPDEFYVHKHTLQACCPAILRRTLESRAIKMVYGEEAKAGRSVKTVEVDSAERARLALTDADVSGLAYRTTRTWLNGWWDKESKTYRRTRAIFTEVSHSRTQIL